MPARAVTLHQGNLVIFDENGNGTDSHDGSSLCDPRKTDGSGGNWNSV